MCDRWYELGIELLEEHQVVRLKSIKKDNEDDKTRCREMFSFWIQSRHKATWYDLVQALRVRAVQMNHVAKDLEDRFNGMWNVNSIKEYVNTCMYACINIFSPGTCPKSPL